MKRRNLTVRLDGNLDLLLRRECRASARTRSEIVREALRRHLALLRFEQLRAKILPFAAARGYFTDEDVFADRR
jgi:predicted transcriptional regulator